jgi:hypothetical protein
MPSLFPSFVTTSRPIISLDGFFSSDMLEGGGGCI